MKTIENNKLIAAFMGLGLSQGIECTGPGFKGYYSKMPSELKYHGAWNELMPVVETIKDNDPDNEARHLIDKIDQALMQTNIKETYNAVVEFIVWYNKNKNIPTLNPIEGINYKLLRAQKESLIKMIEAGKDTFGSVTKADAEMCDGILHLIDSIQDYAVDSLGMKETIVFGIIKFCY